MVKKINKFLKIRLHGTSVNTFQVHYIDILRKTTYNTNKYLN